jgi:hypothetical protein
VNLDRGQAVYSPAIILSQVIRPVFHPRRLVEHHQGVQAFKNFFLTMFRCCNGMLVRVGTPMFAHVPVSSVSLGSMDSNWTLPKPRGVDTILPHLNLGTHRQKPIGLDRDWNRGPIVLRYVKSTMHALPQARCWCALRLGWFEHTVHPGRAQVHLGNSAIRERFGERDWRMMPVARQGWAVPRREVSRGLRGEVLFRKPLRFCPTEYTR